MLARWAVDRGNWLPRLDIGSLVGKQGKSTAKHPEKRPISPLLAQRFRTTFLDLTRLRI
jgi:hypothetical protein